MQLPVTEQVLTAFVEYLYTEKLSPSTVKNSLAAVRHAQIALGLGDPQMGGGRGGDALPQVCGQGTQTTGSLSPRPPEASDNPKDLGAAQESLADLVRPERRGVAVGSSYDVLLWLPKSKGSGGSQ